jgi:hypothetical protein
MRHKNGRLLGKFTAIATLAMAAHGAYADTLLDYEASSGLTPSQLAVKPWTNYGQSMTVANGVLTQHATDGGVDGAPSMEYLSPSLPAGTFTHAGNAYGIEFTVQPLTDTAFVANAWPRAYLTWSDNLFNYNITVDKYSGSNTSGTGDIVYGQGSFSPAITGIDWSVPHTIFIGQRGDGTSSVFDFYLDGTIQSTVVDGSIARSGSFAQDAIDFGDGTTASTSVTANWTSLKVFNVNSPSQLGFTGVSAWISTVSGDWNNSSNWSANVPNAVDGEADFFGAASASHTIYTDTAITVGTLNFNTPNSYDITGYGSMTLQTTTANAQVIVQQGIQKINLPLTLASNTSFNVSSGATLKISDPMTINAGESLTTTGTGSIIYESTVTLLGGASMNIASSTYAHSLSLAATATATLATTSPGAKTVLELDSAPNSSGGTLNVNNNDMIVHSSSSLSSVTSQLTSGFAGGAWTGVGIDSALAASDSSHLHALGVMPIAAAGTFDGKSVAQGDVVVKYTYYGDANLDGKVDGTDYSRIDSGYMTQAKGWLNGDFNYDGVVDGSDYTLIDNAFNQQSSQISSELAVSTSEIAGGLSTSAVPEPTTLGLAGLAAVGVLAKRRRRNSMVLAVAD